MKLNVMSFMWTVAVILAGIFFSLTFNFFRNKKNSSRANVIQNPNHTTPMATTAMVSTVCPFSQNYEIFLNFRGVDTRKTFTDHLYHRLVDVNLCVFRDNEELHVGEEIHPNLLAVIQTSKISIPIISPNYASSKWCLLELVQILKCKETLGQIVIPIFYHVDPSDVRHQKGSFGKAFSLHKKNHNIEIVREWKDALKKVASLKALELNNNVDGYEGKLIKHVVEKVLTDLRKTILVVPEYLVGVDEQAKEIMEMYEKSSHGVQVMLIHGMGGIGKTTLAKFLYNQLISHFQFCSFLESVRETSMQQLQKQLISNVLRKEWPRDIYYVDDGTCIINNTLRGAKVLLILDDVDNGDQLNALMGRHDLFGQGSIIIITSRNRDILKLWHAKLIYELRELDLKQSFQLFCKHALQREVSHCGEFENTARDIVTTTRGLPLAIVVIGSFLLGKDLNIWKETLKKLKRVPDDKVQSKLKISYDALTYEQKQIFLDIACLCPSIDKFEYFIYMWDDCGYYPRSSIEVLNSLSLINVRPGNDIILHDQLRQLGREIVRQQGRDLPGKRIILWNQEEACEVLQRNQGTEQIEVLNLASNKKYENNCFTNEQFERLTKLRFLQMKDAHLVGNFKNCFLNLRWLQWYGCPSNFMAEGFHPKNLVVLDLSKSNVTEQWGGWSEMKYAEKLKVLKLQNCSKLKATPDFSAFKELEILDFSYCKSLSKIHPSICGLTKTLKTFNVSACIELEELPKEMGKLEELRELILNRTPIREIPESFGKLELLQWLDIKDTNIEELPKSIGNLHNLQQLEISQTPIKRLTVAIGKLKELRRFYATGVQGLTEIPKEIRELTRLTMLALIRTSISRLPNLPDSLTSLSFSGNSQLESLPKLPSSLQRLHICGCPALHTLSKFSNLKYISNMEVADCNELMEISGLEEAQSLGQLAIRNCRKLSKLILVGNSLTSFSLSSCDGLKSLPDLSTFKNLTKISLIECNNIVEIKGLDTIKCLEDLAIHDCSSLERIVNLSNLTTLHGLSFGNLPKLRDFDYACIEKLTSLGALWLYGGCPEMKFPNLLKLRNLKNLRVYHFEELKEIPKLQELKSLKYLWIYGCKSLEKLPNFSEGLGNSLMSLWLNSCNGLKSLPDLSTFKNLTKFSLIECNNIVEIKGLNTIKCLEILEIHDCSSLERISDLSSLTKLCKLSFVKLPKLRDFDYACIEKFTSLGALSLQGGCLAMKFPDLPKLRNLKRLGVYYFEELKEIPNLQELKSLEVLRIYGCKSLEKLPNFSKGFGNSLMSFLLNSCDGLKNLPDLSTFKNLTSFSLVKCNNIVEIKGLNTIKCLENLEIHDCSSLGRISDLSSLTTLRKLSFENLTKLRDFDYACIEKLTSLRRLSLYGGCPAVKFPDLSKLRNLKWLGVYHFGELKEIPNLQELKSLEVLRIYGCKSLVKLPNFSEGLGNLLTSFWLNSCDGLKGIPDLSTFKNLTSFSLIMCNSIVEIKGLNIIKCLEILEIHDCSSLERINDLSSLTMLRKLSFGNLPKLRDFDYACACIDKLASLRKLSLYGGCPAMKFPDLPKLKNLRGLGVYHFEELKEIPKLRELKYLEVLRICECKSLEKLPDFSEFTDLYWLAVQDCEKLWEIQGLEKLTQFRRLDVSGCQSLRGLPAVRGDIYLEGRLFTRER